MKLAQRLVNLTESKNKSFENAPYHRFTESPDPDTASGMMMFVEGNPEQVRHFGQYHHVFDPKDLLDDEVVSAASDRFRNELRKVLEEQKEDDFIFFKLNQKPNDETIDELIELANPENIVDSAEFWDNPDLVSFVWEEVLEPNDWFAVITNDGALVFDPDVVKTRKENELGEPV